MIKDGINIDDNQRAVAEKWGFDISDDRFNHYVVTDPVIRASLPKSNKTIGIYGGHANLDALLVRAVEARKLRDEALNGNGAAASNVVALPGLKGRKNKPKAPASGAGKTVAEAVAESPEHEPGSEPEGWEPPQPQPEVEAKAEIVQPPVIETPVEISGAELDDTGKRAKPSKKEPKPKKLNRYLRAARVIVDNLDITPDELTTPANMSLSTAAHMLEAFIAVTSYLAGTGVLKIPGRKVEPATGKGIHFRAREHIAANPKITPKELSAVCGKMTPETASQCIMGFTSICQVLTEKKWLKATKISAE